MLFQCFSDSALYSSGISELNVLYAASTNGAHSNAERPYTQGSGPNTTALSSGSWESFGANRRCMCRTH
eukprot:11134702-Ditylum_brightwellii.AAC.1